MTDLDIIDFLLGWCSYLNGDTEAAMVLAVLARRQECLCREAESRKKFKRNRWMFPMPWTYVGKETGLNDDRIDRAVKVLTARGLLIVKCVRERTWLHVDNEKLDKVRYRHPWEKRRRKQKEISRGLKIDYVN